MVRRTFVEIRSGFGTKLYAYVVIRSPFVVRNQAYAVCRSPYAAHNPLRRTRNSLHGMSNETNAMEQTVPVIGEGAIGGGNVGRDQIPPSPCEDRFLVRVNCERLV